MGKLLLNCDVIVSIRMYSNSCEKSSHGMVFQKNDVLVNLSVQHGRKMQMRRKYCVFKNICIPVHRALKQSFGILREVSYCSDL